MPYRHRRYRDGKRIRAVKRLPRPVGKQERLNAEFYRRRERRKIDSDVRRERNRHAVGNKRTALGRFAGKNARYAAKSKVRVVARKWEDERHIKRVGAERQNAPVAKKERLNEERYRERKTRRFRTEKNGENRSADRVPRRAAGERNVEHHRQKGKRGGDAKRGKALFRKLACYFFHRMNPDGRGCDRENRASRRAEVIVGNMHK